MDSEKVELFEVFRLGPADKATIAKAPLNEIQSKYTLLSAVTSLDQIQNAQALATFPPPGHIIVDKAQFMDMFVKQSQKSVKETTSSLVDNVDHLRERFEGEMVALVQEFKAILDKQIQLTKQQARELPCDATSPDRFGTLLDELNANVFLSLAQHLTGEKKVEQKTNSNSIEEQIK